MRSATPCMRRRKTRETRSNLILHARLPRGNCHPRHGVFRHVSLLCLGVCERRKVDRCENSVESVFGPPTISFTRRKVFFYQRQQSATELGCLLFG